MKAMTRPVLPPIFLRALPTFCAALATAGPAVAVTLDRPSDALEAADDAVSLALEAAWEELCRTAVLRNRNCDCRRSTARDAVTGIFFLNQLATGGKGWEGENDRQRFVSLVQATKSNGRSGRVVGQMDRLVRTDSKGQIWELTLGKSREKLVRRRCHVRTSTISSSQLPKREPLELHRSRSWCQWSRVYPQLSSLLLSPPSSPIC